MTFLRCTEFISSFVMHAHKKITRFFAVSPPNLALHLMKFLHLKQDVVFPISCKQQINFLQVSTLMFEMLENLDVSSLNIFALKSWTLYKQSILPTQLITLILSSFVKFYSCYRLKNPQNLKKQTIQTQNANEIQSN